MITKTQILNLLVILSIAFQSCSDSDDTNNNEDSWSCGDAITDIDGNVYNTVRINDQCWTVQNLNVSKYNDNSSISNVMGQTEWSTTSIGAWSFYDNDPINESIHGKLYNWLAVDTGKLCPEGWHIPSKMEWEILVNELGGSSIAGQSMKSSIGWDNSPDNATNSSGLSVTASGNRDGFDGFIGLGQNVWFYTSTEAENDNTKAYWLKVTSGTDTSIGTSNIIDGLPCRCVLD